MGSTWGASMHGDRSSLASTWLVRLLAASTATTAWEATPCSTALSLAVWLARLPASTSSALATSSSHAQPLESSRNSPSEQEPKRTQSSFCSHGELYMKLRQEYSSITARVPA